MGQAIGSLMGACWGILLGRRTTVLGLYRPEAIRELTHDPPTGRQQLTLEGSGAFTSGVLHLTYSPAA